jgi:hypothetical protein
MSSKVSLILTVVVAAIAVAAIVLTVIVLTTQDTDNGTQSQNGTNGLSDTRTSSYNPDNDLRAEMQEAAQRLVRENSEIFRLFHTLRFTPDSFELEPYGALPVDGFHTLRPGVLAEIATVADIFALVDATFTESAATAVKSDTSRTGGNGVVFSEREGHEGRIGFNSRFVPIPEEQVWGSVGIELVFESATQVLLIVSNSANPEEVREVRMVKDSGQWRLDGLIEVYTAGESDE